MDVDSVQKGKGRGRGSGKGQGSGRQSWNDRSSASSSRGKGATALGSTNRFEGTCHYCGKQGHREADCWQKAREPAPQGGKGGKEQKGGKGKKGKGKGKHTNTLEQTSETSQQNQSSLDLSVLDMSAGGPAQSAQKTDYGRGGHRVAYVSEEKVYEYVCRELLSNQKFSEYVSRELQTNNFREHRRKSARGRHRSKAQAQAQARSCGSPCGEPQEDTATPLDVAGVLTPLELAGPGEKEVAHFRGS